MALRDVRERRKGEAVKFTLQEMADLLGVSLNTYRSYEANPSRLTYEQAVALADRLGCDPKELF